MTKAKSVTKVGAIQHRILLIRGEKVIIDAYLAEAYGVTTPDQDGRSLLPALYGDSADVQCRKSPG